MKEFDLASAKRKFEETILLYKNEHQTIETGFCFKILPGIDNFTYYINDENDIIQQTTDPLYHEIKNGFYENKKDPNGYTLIIRKPNKTFKIGANPQTHDFLSLTHNPKTKKTLFKTTSHWYTTRLNKPVSINTEDLVNSLTNYGPISTKIWLTKTNVFYLTKRIGMRKESTFVINNLFQPQIKQILKDFPITIL